MTENISLADRIADIIRRVDGDHTMGAGELGEHIANELEGAGIVAESNPSLNVTREGIEVKPGQVWFDLDERATIRRITVLSVHGGKARVDRGIRKTTISVSRMHNHSTGFRLVKDA